MTLVLVLTFCTAVLLVITAASLTAHDPLKERMARLRGITRGRKLKGEVRGILNDEIPSPVGQVLALLAGRNLDLQSSSLIKIRRRLLAAGYRRPSSLRIYLGCRIALAALLPLLLFISPLAESIDTFRFTFALCGAALIGTVLPSFLLDRRIKSRQLAIERGLPDALDLMVVCIEAGLGLTAVIARVATEYGRSNPTLAEEFELVALEAQAGKSNVDALRGLATRTSITEVSALVAMLVHTERFGTSVADALRVHSEAMRVRRIQKAEESAAKAQIKMLFPAGIFIFPATLIVIAAPGLMRLVATLAER